MQRTPLVDTLCEDPRWEGFALDTIAESAATAALSHLGISPAGFEISLMGCDDARIATLNAEFRDKPKPTNVLSWPAEDRMAEEEGGTPDLPEPGAPDDPESLGDIAIAWETCEREAAEQKKPMKDHVTHLVIHATLHLMGYDHETEADAALMEGAEIAILAGLGLANPYE
ncbi:rRNA maturation RNase YbeY [Frigidibacter sp. MR17.24]|uniref:rRNA maturation RNase YbeY n=1 Tax=Frigidibacter sp. MR17.24 TaxID=3127345 RepID=UPI003012D283